MGCTWPHELNHLPLAICHLYIDNLFLEAKFNETDFSDVKYESIYDFSDESDMKLLKGFFFLMNSSFSHLTQKNQDELALCFLTEPPGHHNLFSEYCNMLESTPL